MIIKKDFYKSDIYRFDFEHKDNGVELEVSNVISWDSIRVCITKDELKGLADFINKFLQTSPQVAAYAQINDKGDLFDLSLQNNPFNNQQKVIPLYRI
jgi:hypothetical protein